MLVRTVIWFVTYMYISEKFIVITFGIMNQVKHSVSVHMQLDFDSGRKIPQAWDFNQIGVLLFTEPTFYHNFTKANSVAT